MPGGADVSVCVRVWTVQGEGVICVCACVCACACVDSEG